MTKEDILKLRAWAELYDVLDEFVILKEDENCRYIEYIFKEGRPHDNRCLSWYDKIQPDALIRNGHDIKKWESEKLHNVGEIYRLHQMSCGHENNTDESHCSPGHPCVKCVKEGWTHDWTYSEPVKCACWLCNTIHDMDGYHVKLKDIDNYIKIYNRLCQEQTKEQ